MKSTAVAPTNIALVKYWGKKDAVLRLPLNGSISVNLSAMLTTTTVEFNNRFSRDSVLINSKSEPRSDSRVEAHLDRIRNIAKISSRAKVVSQSNFPDSTGLSSSASGFAALTVAAAAACELNLSEKELSVIARQGSGSACRSIPDGFTEWLDGKTSDSSYAVSIFPASYWMDLVDIVAVVSADKKEIPTTEGMTGFRKSPFYLTRLMRISEKLQDCRDALKEKDFEKLGELSESEALEMHAVMITQKPALLYWTSGTLQLMKLVQKWRQGGLPCYFTINTGQNIHILTLNQHKNAVLGKLKGVDFTQQIIVNSPSAGARLIDSHLF